MRKSDKRAFWEAHVKDWNQSGLTQTEYCRKHRLERSSFNNWKRRLNPSKEPALVRWQASVDANAPGQDCIEVRLGRWQVRIPVGIDQGELAKVLTVIGGLP